MNNIISPLLPHQQTSVFNTNSTGSPPYENTVEPVGTIKPKDFATWTANMILTAGGKQSTAFKCALLIAEDMERRGLI